MRAILRWIPLSTVLLFGCATASYAPAAPPFRTVASVKQLMEWVIDPAADIIWDSVKSVSTDAGTKEFAPHTDAEWATVRNATVVVAESGNLLMIESRARDGKEWMSAARRLTIAADIGRKAAESRNADALFAAGGDIYEACSGCHRRYAEHPGQ